MPLCWPEETVPWLPLGCSPWGTGYDRPTSGGDLAASLPQQRLSHRLRECSTQCCVPLCRSWGVTSQHPSWQPEPIRGLLSVTYLRGPLPSHPKWWRVKPKITFMMGLKYSLVMGEGRSAEIQGKAWVHQTPGTQVHRWWLVNLRKTVFGVSLLQNF